MFCDLINQTISDRLIQFYSIQYASTSVVSQTSFESEINSSIDEFRSSLPTNFLLSLSLIRDTTHANALLSTLQNNYRIYVRENTSQTSTYPKIYDDCNCASSVACISQSSIYDYSSGISLFDVPGFYTGCYVIESLLQSTLQCFYDQQCVDHLLHQISLTPRIEVASLDESLSKYSANLTIQKLVDNLMIEEWNYSSSFENYYNQCQPIKCIHTLETNNDIIYIATTLFGISGGLITVLKIIIPRLIKLIRKKTQQQHTATGKFFINF
jgi:hypothetical protein